MGSLCAFNRTAQRVAARTFQAVAKRRRGATFLPSSECPQVRFLTSACPLQKLLALTKLFKHRIERRRPLRC
jgi:hypothetical protein